MKIASLVLIILGALALLLAVAEKFLGVHVLPGGPAGYLRGADALFLFALALMAYCKCCCAKPPAQP